MLNCDMRSNVWSQEHDELTWRQQCWWPHSPSPGPTRVSTPTQEWTTSMSYLFWLPKVHRFFSFRIVLFYQTAPGPGAIQFPKYLHWWTSNSCALSLKMNFKKLMVVTGTFYCKCRWLKNLSLDKFVCFSLHLKTKIGKVCR